MHYIIDGYNFAFRLESDHQGTQELREHVISLLRRIKLSSKAQLILVFDSQSQEEIPYWHRYTPISVVFAPKGLSADCWIFEFLQGQKLPSKYTVVSDDRQLRKRCQAVNAQTMTLHTFWKKFRPELQAQIIDVEIKPTNLGLSDLYVQIFQKRFTDIFSDKENS